MIRDREIVLRELMDRYDRELHHGWSLTRHRLEALMESRESAQSELNGILRAKPRAARVED